MQSSTIRTLLAPLLASGLLLAPGSADAFKDPWKPPPPYKGPSRRFITVLHPNIADCPTIPGWAETKLFANKATLLQRFCRYTANAQTQAVNSLKHRSFEASSPDYDVLVPQTDLTLAANSAVRGALATAYYREMGVEPSKVRQPVYSQPQNLPRVAVIDTVPTNYDPTTSHANATPRAQHGLAMAEIIGDIRCPNGEKNCRTRTFFVDAYRTDPTDPAVFPSSNTLGGMGALAQAILDAVDTAPGAPLILNLSLGWDPDRFGTITVAMHQSVLTGGVSKNMPSASALAVHSAMLYAVCHGALPIAAAGNNNGGACEERGPLAPASWEQLSAPNSKQCKALFGTPEKADAVPVAAGRLVYAAGGLEGTKMIPIARKGSRPPRLVAAFTAVAGRNWRQTAPWTGTSVAAAGVSGLAAMVWSNRPDLDAHGVMLALDASGVETDLPVELGAGSKARKLTGYSAYSAICKDSACNVNPYKSHHNPIEPGVPNRPDKSIEPGAPNLPDLSKDPSLVLTNEQITDVAAIEAIHDAPEGNLLTLSKELLMSCGQPRPHYFRSSRDPTVPPVGGVSLPWTRPQPETPICPYCPVKGGTLFLSVNPKFAENGQTSVTLTDPLLEFATPTGYISVTLVGTITVPPAGKEISLARYKVRYGNEEKFLSEVVALSTVTAGTLTVFVRDASNAIVGVVSVVQVLH